jgi:IS30 family transposase
MSKLIDPNDYIKLSTYAEKYTVCKRKLYRYIKYESIDYAIIDDIRFIRDIQYISLETDHRTKNANDIVTTMTLDSDNHGEVSQVPDFKEDSNVTTMTKDNVTTLTIQMSEILLLTKNEKECSLGDFQKIKEIKEKYKII